MYGSFTASKNISDDVTMPIFSDISFIDFSKEYSMVFPFAGGLLISRTLAVLVTMTLAASMAAREGPIRMAGYQICTQVWLAVSLLTDALALSGQVLDFYRCTVIYKNALS